MTEDVENEVEKVRMADEQLVLLECSDRVAARKIARQIVDANTDKPVKVCVRNDRCGRLGEEKEEKSVLAGVGGVGLEARRELLLNASGGRRYSGG